MSTYVCHNLENEINEFFSNTNVNRQQCDELAISRAGGVATPVESQGTCSYTITAGPNNAKLFQFRVQDSFIDMGNLSIAKAVHPEFVARCEYLGTIGDSHPLHIYEMDNLPGTIYMLAGIPPDDMSRRHNIVKDLARFFAQSWNNNQNNNQRLSADHTAALLSEFQSNFDLLVRDLPSRFTSNLNRVRKELPSVSSGAFPL
ncbi:hypothetical protein PENDEC_c012G03212 [Penicillium decumbens]|uniref:Aminoglycoside phosphotransferase domain-containing protein n=1 Tax=Penicillium decumbens TaxID=69771 RepID=A0A1V6PCC2_PENDC|nr:hypothetical protein PENDEC_c012G03212 [Penicillium decumbens]